MLNFFFAGENLLVMSFKNWDFLSHKKEFVQNSGLLPFHRTLSQTGLAISLCQQQNIPTMRRFIDEHSLHWSSYVNSPHYMLSKNSKFNFFYFTKNFIVLDLKKKLLWKPTWEKREQQQQPVKLLLPQNKQKCSNVHEKRERDKN